MALAAKNARSASAKAARLCAASLSGNSSRVSAAAGHPGQRQGGDQLGMSSVAVGFDATGSRSMCLTRLRRAVPASPRRRSCAARVTRDRWAALTPGRRQLAAGRAAGRLGRGARSPPGRAGRSPPAAAASRTCSARAGRSRSPGPRAGARRRAGRRRRRSGVPTQAAPVPQARPLDRGRERRPAAQARAPDRGPAAGVGGAARQASAAGADGQAQRRGRGAGGGPASPVAPLGRHRRADRQQREQRRGPVGLHPVVQAVEQQVGRERRG